MPISPQKSIGDDRVLYLIQLLEAHDKGAVSSSSYISSQELHIVRDKARAELATLLRKDFLAEKPTVAAGGYRG